MRATLRRLLPLLASAIPWLPPASGAADLMCQISGSPSSNQPPVSIHLQALVFGGTTPYTYAWDLGDGNSSTEQNPSHLYFQSGIFQIILTVTDEASAQCIDTLLVFSGIVADPLCVSSGSVTWGEAPLTVDFSAWPGLVGDPEPYTWSWQFGDGETSELQLPSHTYTEPGTYWAVATLHTPLHDYECFEIIRISATPSETVGLEPNAKKISLHLEPARPNPFELMTTLTFDLPRSGPVRLVIVDAAGRSVATLVDGHRPAGPNVAIWQGRSDTGGQVPPGVYFAVLEQESEARSIRIARL